MRYPLYYFPPTSFFSLVQKNLKEGHANETKAIEIAIYQSYKKQTWMNRCQVLMVDGVKNLSIPVHGKEGDVLSSVKIANNQSWQRAHWRTLQTAYGKSPYWSELAPFFQTCYERDFSYLHEFNLAILRLCLDLVFQGEFSLQVLQEGDEKGIEQNLTQTEEWQLSQAMSDYSTFKPYTQRFSSTFLPNLSIIDTLMNCGIETSSYL